MEGMITGQVFAYGRVSRYKRLLLFGIEIVFA